VSYDSFIIRLLTIDNGPFNACEILQKCTNVTTPLHYESNRRWQLSFTFTKDSLLLYLAKTGILNKKSIWLFHLVNTFPRI